MRDFWLAVSTTKVEIEHKQSCLQFVIEWNTTSIFRLISDVRADRSNPNEGQTCWQEAERPEHNTAGFQAKNVCGFGEN